MDRRRPHGLTLIELLVTLSVLAIVAALALPGFGETLRRNRIATTSHLLTASFAMARSAAVMRGHPVSVCPADATRHCREDGVWEDGWIVFLDAQRTGQPASDADILRVTDPLGGDVVVRATEGRDHARFQPDGRSGGSTLTLRLCAADDHRTLRQVILNNHGRVRSALPDANDAGCAH